MNHEDGVFKSREDSGQRRNSNDMIACWLTRRKIDWELDDGAEVSAAVGLHLSRCAACARYRRRQQALVEGLIGEARQNPSSSPLFFRERASVLPKRYCFFRGGGCFAWRQGLVWFAAAVVVVVGILWFPPGEAPSSPSSELIAKALHFSGPQALEEAAGQSLQEWSALLNQPLESEIQFLINDARFAMISLVASFLPEQYLAPVADGRPKALSISL